MDDRCPQGTQPAHTTVGKAQASSPRDPREEPSEKIKIQDKLSYSSHSENVGKASKKKNVGRGRGSTVVRDRLGKNPPRLPVYQRQKGSQASC